MGDVDDADPLFLRLLDQGEQAIGFALGKRGGRLVQDQDRQLGAERLGDLHHLLLGARQVGHALRRSDGKVEPIENFFGAGAQFPLVEQTAAAHFRPEKQVLLHGQLWHQGEFLEHRTDAQRAGVMYRMQIDRPATEVDGPGFRALRTHNDRNKCRFPGAVLAEQYVHLARPQIEVHLVKGENPGKSLGYAFEFEEGRTFDTRRSVPPRNRINHDSPSVGFPQSTMKVGLKFGAASDDS